MSDTAEKTAEPEVLPVREAIVRRFQLPDIDRHGVWILGRMQKAYPQLGQPIGWLRSILYSNEFHFLFGEFTVGLFQLERNQTLQPKPVVRERFVWIRQGLEKEDQEQAELEAEAMYADTAKWGKFAGANQMIVLENSDVPEHRIRGKFKRVLERPQKFVTFE